MDAYRGWKKRELVTEGGIKKRGSRDKIGWTARDPRNPFDATAAKNFSMNIDQPTPGLIARALALPLWGDFGIFPSPSSIATFSPVPPPLFFYLTGWTCIGCIIHWSGETSKWYDGRDNVSTFFFRAMFTWSYLWRMRVRGDVLFASSNQSHAFFFILFFCFLVSLITLVSRSQVHDEKKEGGGKVGGQRKTEGDSVWRGSRVTAELWETRLN